MLPVSPSRCSCDIVQRLGYWTEFHKPEIKETHFFYFQHLYVQKKRKEKETRNLFARCKENRTNNIIWYYMTPSEIVVQAVEWRIITRIVWAEDNGRFCNRRFSKTAAALVAAQSILVSGDLRMYCLSSLAVSLYVHWGCNTGRKGKQTSHVKKGKNQRVRGTANVNVRLL